MDKQGRKRPKCNKRGTLGERGKEREREKKREREKQRDSFGILYTGYLLSLVIERERATNNK